MSRLRATLLAAAVATALSAAPAFAQVGLSLSGHGATQAGAPFSGSLSPGLAGASSSTARAATSAGLTSGGGPTIPPDLEAARERNRERDLARLGHDEQAVDAGERANAVMGEGAAARAGGASATEGIYFRALEQARANAVAKER